jgi:hypothetical protein
LPGETLLLKGSDFYFLSSEIDVEVNGFDCIVINATSTVIAMQLSAELSGVDLVGIVFHESHSFFTPPLSIASPQNVSSASVTAPYAGETIVLYGNGWSTTSRVTFDGTDLDQFEHSSGHVRFTVPANARLGVPVDVVIHPRSGSQTITYELVVVARVDISPSVSYVGTLVTFMLQTASPEQLLPALPEQLTCSSVLYEQVLPGSDQYRVSLSSPEDGVLARRCDFSGTPFGAAFEHRLVTPAKIANSTC